MFPDGDFLCSESKFRRVDKLLKVSRCAEQKNDVCLPISSIGFISLRNECRLVIDSLILFALRVDIRSRTSFFLGLRLDELLKKFRKFVDRDFPVAIRVQRVKHRENFCFVHVTTQTRHDQLNFVGRQKTVSVFVVFLENGFDFSLAVTTEESLTYFEFEFVKVDVSTVVGVKLIE